MIFRSLVIVLCVAIFTSGCASLLKVNVDYEYDPEADFASLKSYDWFPVPRINVRYDLLIKQIKSEMSNQLKGKGYRKDSEEPDILIALHGGFQMRMDFRDWEYLYENYETYWAKRRLDLTRYEDHERNF